ncbi:hypothetical protein BDF22DRAFT_669624 [Syncephalis plumigaleata]|nr:hypothetical protein BDF22DRAFT_669624 [Syncephalis plumigaleata]
MTHLSMLACIAICVIALTLLNVVNVSAHGFLTYPPPRGFEKKSSEIDALKNPNLGGQICRGESAGTVTDVGHSVTLQFDITAPHIGPCAVYILDENLSNPQKIAEKDDCAAPGKTGPWTINIPNNISGRKVLRWTWDAKHLVTTTEPYENCADINIS